MKTKNSNKNINKKHSNKRLEYFLVKKEDSFIYYWYIWLMNMVIEFIIHQTIWGKELLLNIRKDGFKDIILKALNMQLFKILGMIAKTLKIKIISKN